MADIDNTQPSLEDEVAANRAIEQGLGLGARELAAQREPGGVITPDEDDDAVDEDEQLSRTSDA